MSKEPTCVDLRPWAKANRYRWRYEESYQAERPEHRGVRRWYVEILCRHGLIYPKGGNILLAYSSRGLKRQIAELAGVEHHQYDDDGEVFRFPAERLDDVAALLKPKRLPGSAVLSPKQRENLERHAFRGGQKSLETRLDQNEGIGQG